MADPKDKIGTGYEDPYWWVLTLIVLPAIFVGAGVLMVFLSR